MGASPTLKPLVERYALPDDVVPRLARLLELVAAEPTSITSIRDQATAVDVHVADSLVGLELDVLRDAARVADMGSGGGFPGLVLAVALPQTHVALIESTGRKCAFLHRVVAELGLENVEVVCARVEEWSAGLDQHDVVTCRALAPLAVLLEYGAPLLREGGVLVAWKGRRDEDEERDAAAAAEILSMAPPTAQRVEPFPWAEDRHLLVSAKLGPTPERYPRRAGMARKRPLRADGPR